MYNTQYFQRNKRFMKKKKKLLHQLHKQSVSLAVGGKTLCLYTVSANYKHKYKNKKMKK